MIGARAKAYTWVVVVVLGGASLTYGGLHYHLVSKVNTTPAYRGYSRNFEQKKADMYVFIAGH